MDMGDHYNFDATDSLTISDACSSTITIINDHGGGNVKDAYDDRYGMGDCDLTVTSTLTNWSILFGKQVGETFDDATVTYDIDEMDNTGGGTACEIDTTGGASADEEYGFNLSINPGVIYDHTETDGDCGTAYYTADDFFNVEDSGSEDEIVRVDDGTGVTGGLTFTMQIHASVDSTTVATDYALGTSVIISTNP
jgi:hypothetical protein